MEKIHKYKLETTDIQHIEMPAFARILCVQVQNKEPHLWAIFDDVQEQCKHTRTIEIIGTGNQTTGTSRKYIGTYQLADGQLVFHVFEYTGEDKA